MHLPNREKFWMTCHTGEPPTPPGSGPAGRPKGLKIFNILYSNISNY